MVYFLSSFWFKSPQHFFYTSPIFTVKPVTHVSLEKWMFPFQPAHLLRCSSNIGHMAGYELDAKRKDGKTKYLLQREALFK